MITGIVKAMYSQFCQLPPVLAANIDESNFGSIPWAIPSIIASLRAMTVRPLR